MIPRSNEDLDALREELPLALHTLVTLWCYGKSIPEGIKPASRSSYYRQRRILAEYGIDLEQPHPAPFDPPKREPLVAYTVAVTGATMSYHTWAGPVMKDGVFLSAQGRLCALEKAARVDSPELARELIDARLDALKRTHGDNLVCEVTTIQTPEAQEHRERIKQDTSKATDYLARKFRKSPRSRSQSG